MVVQMNGPLNRLHRTKTLLASVVLFVVGSGMLVADRAVSLSSRPDWVGLVPIAELGGILVGAAILSVWLDRYLRREQEEVDELRLRRIMHEQAPVMRDAVLEAFAADHADLERVANPETVDAIIRNGLAVRLKDRQFATEIYDDVRRQAVEAGERWYDAALSIRLAPLPAGRRDATGVASGKRSYLSVTVRWEYSVLPKYAQRRFVCVSDREEYAEVASDTGATSPWFLKSETGVDATSPEAYQLLQFTVDGMKRPIRRAVRKEGQIYTVTMKNDDLEASKPVVVSYTYQTVTSVSDPLLFFDIEQPTRDLRIDFDYTGCGIGHVSTLDLVPSVRRPRIETVPKGAAGEVVRVDIDGWVFPRSGVAFVWT